ncbi:hypothetical protein ACIA8O_22490 [Kitasatospora sp. NPDC051853]|uniref:hypothetical protein n=1 Tax=Kitasatospora sp. NPDC051853 TaxID=3364058 RepID=UPI00379D77A3
MSSAVKARITAALVSVLAAGSLIAAGASPATAATASSPANGGALLSGAAAAQDAASARARAVQQHLMSPGDTLCTGTWTHAVSTVQFQRAAGGTLAWSFKLSNASQSALGPTVTVTMPYAYVDGKAVNPPYGPHTEPNWYNFHGSMNGYQFIGGGGGTIQTGNKLTFYWFLKGSTPNTAADRYITCQVPTPGSA